MRKPDTKSQYDYAGIASSVLCLIHCLLSPLIILSLGMAGDAAAFELMEYSFLLLSAYAVVRAVQHTHSPTVRVLLPVFFALFAVAIFTEHAWAYAQPVSYVASVSLVLLHIVNIRSCQQAHG